MFCFFLSPVVSNGFDDVLCKACIDKFEGNGSLHSFDRILLSAFEFDVYDVIKKSRYLSQRRCLLWLSRVYFSEWQLLNPALLFLDMIA